MTTYQEGVGIYHSDPLMASDIGNVLTPGTRASTAGNTIPAGTPGRMNTGLVTFAGDPYTGDGALSETEILTVMPNGRRVGLTQIYRNQKGVPVGVRTVERWFDLPGPKGQHQPQNCVPVAALGLRIGCMPGTQIYLGFGNAVPGEEVLLRCILACCLGVEGGLQRVPLWTRGDRYGNPYEVRENFALVADCVQYLWDVYTGEVVTADGLPLDKAWVQMTIEPSTTGAGWDAVVLWFAYASQEEYDAEEAFCNDV